MRRDARPLRLLLIARAYPPTVGGMENAAFQLAEHLRGRCELTVIANRRGKKALPLFLACALLRALILARGGRIDAVHLADGLLAPVGLLIKRIGGVPVTCSVNGLDITWPSAPYQTIVPRALALLDHAMPISEATAAEVRRRTRGRLPMTVVALGVNPLPPADADAAAQFRAQHGIAPGARVLLTVSRLVRRKGATWFVEHVLPQLADDVIYVLVGDGPERESIVETARRCGVADRVRLAGRVDDAALAAAYAAADVFVMPNVRVAGDMEGFGLVALEAASAGVPVIAARLEGITEAVRDGQNGTLVAPVDAAAWTAAIAQALALPQHELRAVGARGSAWTRAHCSWDSVAARFMEIIRAEDAQLTPLAA